MPMLTILMADVPAADAGNASGMANVTMQVGGAFGLAVLATISTDQTRRVVAHGHSLVSALTGGYQLGFAIAAACVAAGVLIAILVLRSPNVPRIQRATHQPPTDDLENAA
jgi:hypothetical protein